MYKCAVSCLGNERWFTGQSCNLDRTRDSRRAFQGTDTSVVIWTWRLEAAGKTTDKIT